MSVKTKMTAIADAIRNATGITSEMTIDQMISNVPFIEGAAMNITSGLIDRSVTNYVIPSGVASIGNSAFQQCTLLTSITIPSGVTSIGNYAFDACASLTSITLPSGVTSIGIAVFRDCTSLMSITLPASLTSIGNNAFQICTSLTSITLPAGVTSIGRNVFSSCTNLTDIYCGFSEGAVSGAPWGAPDTTAIHYNSQGE